MLDKGLTFVLPKLGFNLIPPAASFTGGLVGDSSPFTVLPQVIIFSYEALILMPIFESYIEKFQVLI